jgi:ABC-type multidrug transport system fused ATPase/permease subunit
VSVEDVEYLRAGARVFHNHGYAILGRKLISLADDISEGRSIQDLPKVRGDLFDQLKSETRTKRPDLSGVCDCVVDNLFLKLFLVSYPGLFTNEEREEISNRASATRDLVETLLTVITSKHLTEKQRYIIGCFLFLAMVEGRYRLICEVIYSLVHLTAEEESTSVRKVREEHLSKLLKELARLDDKMVQKLTADQEPVFVQDEEGEWVEGGENLSKEEILLAPIFFKRNEIIFLRNAIAHLNMSYDDKTRRMMFRNSDGTLRELTFQEFLALLNFVDGIDRLFFMAWQLFNVAFVVLSPRI